MARARSFGNIRKLPSGRYQARYWHLGKQIPADTTFANKTDARRWLATIEADMFRGVWINPNAGKIPFGEYAERWVAERRCARGRVRSTRASSATWCRCSPTSTSATSTRSRCGRGTVGSQRADCTTTRWRRSTACSVRS